MIVAVLDASDAPAPIDAVIVPLAAVTRLPAPSSTRTTGCVASATPDDAVADGDVPKTSEAAVPALSVTDACSVRVPSLYVRR